MKKLIALTTLIVTALFAVPTYAQSPVATDNSIVITGDVDLSFQREFVEQGVVVGTNVTQAALNLDISSFVIGIDSYQEVSKQGLVAAGFKRLDVTAGYKFTSLLADLTLGITDRNSNHQLSLNGVGSDPVVFLKLNGKATKYFGWDIQYLNDIKNKSNNYEADINSSIPLKWGFVLVPAIGVGINDPGANTIAVLETAKRYGTASTDVTYPTSWGTFAVGYMYHRDDVYVSANPSSGFEASYKLTF